VKRFPNGCTYVGEFVQGLIQGKGSFTWPDGRQYNGEWHDQQMRGIGTMTFTDQTGQCVYKGAHWGSLFLKSFVFPRVVIS